jgi:hypothetical protein
MAKWLLSDLYPDMIDPKQGPFPRPPFPPRRYALSAAPSFGGCGEQPVFHRSRFRLWKLPPPNHSAV